MIQVCVCVCETAAFTITVRTWLPPTGFKCVFTGDNKSLALGVLLWVQQKLECRSAIVRTCARLRSVGTKRHTLTRQP